MSFIPFGIHDVFSNGVWGHLVFLNILVVCRVIVLMCSSIVPRVFNLLLLCQMFVETLFLCVLKCPSMSLIY